MRLLFDIEANGLLKEATKVWCLVTRDLDTGEVSAYDPFTLDAGLQHLGEADVLVGHNIIDYDLRLLEKLHGFRTNATLEDTLVWSRTIFPDIREQDLKRLNANKVMIGSHSLKAWGIRLAIHKGDFGQADDAWDRYTPEMLEYCKQDVEVNYKLYQNLVNKIAEWKPWPEVLRFETEVHKLLQDQTTRGFPFDVTKAEKLYSELAGEKAVLEQSLVSNIEPTVVQLKTKEKVIPFNPASRQQIADRLMKRGWKPESFTPSGDPKVDEDTLSAIDMPEAKQLCRFLLLNKRIGQLATGKQAWLKVQQDGHVHGRVNHMGAVTSRCTHSDPNVAQVPSLGAEYGKECRELFHAPEGYSLLGADASGLELRCLAAYMKPYDNGNYVEEILNGDIHSKNQEAAGLATRPQAKTFIYAFLFGAGDEKIGSIIGGSKRDGKKIKARFLKQTPALKILREKVSQKAKGGYIKGIDGRRIPIRHPHAALNTLLQSCGAVICKKWYVEIHKLFREAGLTENDARIVAFVHDEVQIVVRNGMEEQVGEITLQAIRNVERHLDFGCRLDAEYNIGQSWAATH